MLTCAELLKYTTPFATASSLRPGAPGKVCPQSFSEASLFKAITAPVGGKKGGISQLTPLTNTTPSLTALSAKRPSEPAQEGTACTRCTTAPVAASSTQ